MLRYIVVALCGLSLSGSVYMAGWGYNHTGMDMANGTCCETPASAKEASPAAITLPESVTDVKNTMCIVKKEDIEGSTLFVTYKEKAYRICCSSCVAEFKADPEKFVKALEADPAKFGVKK